MMLAYPENETYDGENGERIYRQCAEMAELVIKYGKNGSDILRAHMIMAMLHAAYGNTAAAWEHAAFFPVRADMTFYEISARIAHFEKDREKELDLRRSNFLCHVEALLDNAACLRDCRSELSRTEKAEKAEEALPRRADKTG